MSINCYRKNKDLNPQTNHPVKIVIDNVPASTNNKEPLQVGITIYTYLYMTHEKDRLLAPVIPLKTTAPVNTFEAARSDYLNNQQKNTTEVTATDVNTEYSGYKSYNLNTKYYSRLGYTYSKYAQDAIPTLPVDAGVMYRLNSNGNIIPQSNPTSFRLVKDTVNIDYNGHLNVRAYNQIYTQGVYVDNKYAGSNMDISNIYPSLNNASIDVTVKSNGDISINRCRNLVSEVFDTNKHTGDSTWTLRWDEWFQDYGNSTFFSAFTVSSKYGGNIHISQDSVAYHNKLYGNIEDDNAEIYNAYGYGSFYYALGFNFNITPTCTRYLEPLRNFARDIFYGTGINNYYAGDNIRFRQLAQLLCAYSANVTHDEYKMNRYRYERLALYEHISKKYNNKDFWMGSTRALSTPTVEQDLRASGASNEYNKLLYFAGQNNTQVQHDQPFEAQLKQGDEFYYTTNSNVDIQSTDPFKYVFELQWENPKTKTIEYLNPSDITIDSIEMQKTKEYNALDSDYYYRILENEITPTDYKRALPKVMEDVLFKSNIFDSQYVNNTRLQTALNVTPTSTHNEKRARVKQVLKYLCIETLDDMPVDSLQTQTNNLIQTSKKANDVFNSYKNTNGVINMTELLGAENLNSILSVKGNKTHPYDKGLKLDLNVSGAPLKTPDMFLNGYLDGTYMFTMCSYKSQWNADAAYPLYFYPSGSGTIQHWYQYMYVLPVKIHCSVKCSNVETTSKYVEDTGEFIDGVSVTNIMYTDFIDNSKNMIKISEDTSTVTYTDSVDEFYFQTGSGKFTTIKQLLQQYGTTALNTMFYVSILNSDGTYDEVGSDVAQVVFDDRLRMNINFNRSKIHDIITSLGLTGGQDTPIAKVGFRAKIKATIGSNFESTASSTQNR